jgi:RNA polymerase sigma-70 factor (ECF subfamily)
VKDLDPMLALVAYAFAAEPPLDRLGWPAAGKHVVVVNEPDRAQAFERVALPHLPAAFRLARWLARDPHDAEDVLQEAYLRAYRYFESFSGKDAGKDELAGSSEDARTWLLSIVRNTFRTYREKNPAPAAGDAVDATRLAIDGSADVLAGRREPAPDERAASVSERSRIDAAIHALPAEFREVIVLRELEGLSYKGIAAVARIPIGTVMSRLSRAREDLRQLLSPKLGESPDAERRIG